MRTASCLSGIFRSSWSTRLSTVVVIHKNIFECCFSLRTKTNRSVSVHLKAYEVERKSKCCFEYRKKAMNISYYCQTTRKCLPRLFRLLQLCADRSVEGNECRGMVGEIQSALVSAVLTSHRSPQPQRATVWKCLPDRHWSTRFYCDCFSHSA